MLWNAGFVLNQKGAILGIRFLNNWCILHRYYTNPRPNPYNLTEEQPPFFKEEKQHRRGFLTGSCLKSFNGTSDGLKIGKGRQKNLNECLIILKTLNASFTLLSILCNCKLRVFICFSTKSIDLCILKKHNNKNDEITKVYFVLSICPEHWSIHFRRNSKALMNNKPTEVSESRFH